MKSCGACLTLTLLVGISQPALAVNPPPPPPVLRMPGSSKPLAAKNSPKVSPKIIPNALVATNSPPVQMKILVLAGDSSEYSYQSITTFLDQIGVPYTGIAVDTLTLDSSGNRLDNLALSNPSTGQGLYQGIIETNSNFEVCNPSCVEELSTADFTKLDSYQAQYQVRVVSYYTWPEAKWGLSPVGSGASYGASNPLEVTLTSAGASIFSYINSANPIPVAGSGTGGIWAYEATPVAAAGETTTPILMAGQYTVGVIHTTSSGLQSMSLTFDNYPTLLHSLAFSYGVVNWVTNGVFLGARRVYINIQDDDLLFGDRLYAPALPLCPNQPTCPDVEMSSADLQALLNWQIGHQADPQTSNLSTTFAFVGFGETFGPAYAQEAQTMAQETSNYGWVTHTYTHTDPDCFTMTPSGACVLATLQEGLSDLELNSVFGAGLGLPADSTGFVTPFNNGLDDQPYLTAAAWEGVTSVISPAAPPGTNAGGYSTLVPSLYLIPRVTTNLLWNEDSPYSGVYGSLPDQYNALYGPNGTDPFFITNQTYSQIINNESTNFLLMRLLTGEPFPVGFHTSNTVTYDGVHSLMSDLFDAAIQKYEQICSIPIYSLQNMRDIAPVLEMRQSYDSSGVTGVYTPGVSVVLTTVNGATIPVTGACSQATCPRYGGQMQDMVSMAPNSSVTLSLSAGTGPGLSAVAANPSSVGSLSPSQGLVILNGIATASATVTLSSNSAAVVVPASVTVTPGNSGAAFTISTGQVSAVTTASISATYLGVTQSTTVTINPAVALTGVALNPASVGGGGSSTGTVTLTSAAPVGGIVISLLSNNVAAIVPSTVTVPAGSSSATFTVNASSVTSTTTGNIVAIYNFVTQTAPLFVTNGSSISLTGVSLNPVTVTGGGASIGTVTLSGPAPSGGVTVSLSSNSGSVTVPSSIAVAPGSTSAIFSLTTTAVTTTTAAIISAVYSGTTETASFTITPGVSLSSLSLNPVSVVGGTSSTGTVTLSGAAPSTAVSVSLSSSSASATMPSTVTVPSGSTSAAFTITTTAVTSTTAAVISAVYSGTTTTASLTITPPVALSGFSVSPSSVSGGNSATGTVTLTGAAPAGGIPVSLSSNSGSATVPSSVTVVSGSTSATFTVTTTAVVSTSTAVVSAIYSGTTKTASLSILPVGYFSALSLSPLTVAGGSTSTGTVTFTAAAPAGGHVVSLLSNNSVAVVPASVTVPAGSVSANFTITTKAANYTALPSVTGTYGGTNISATLTIVGLSSVSLSPASIQGSKSSTGTVRLTASAPSGGAVVALSSSSSSAVVPASVTVLSGQSSATFTIATKTVSSSTKSTIGATLGGLTESASLTITVP